jgi:uncharacterized protein with HEPN domain
MSSMPSRDPGVRFGDIVREIDLIKEFIGGRSAALVSSDMKTVRAIERSLQIISEAAIKLGPKAEQLIPHQPWAEIRGLGNVLRHDYHEVSFDRLWQTVQIHLDSLYSECLAQIAPHARRRMPKKSD